MNIREDFSTVSEILQRLLHYAATFEEYNQIKWSHLKNKEDFEKIYRFPEKQKRQLEEIYQVGRDIAVFMSDKLIDFNDSGRYPTLTSYINSFKNGWLYGLDQLRDISIVTKNITAEIGPTCPWAISQMIILFDRQIDMLEQVKKCLDSLTHSDVYKWENGQNQETFSAIQDEKILQHIYSQLMYFSKVSYIFSDHDEEQLRDFILSSLAPNIKGSITGESFNYQGKTDILIQGDQSTNILIGECKIWRGESCVLPTIDQLLSYLTWNDTKAVIIFFVKNKNLTDVIEKIKEKVLMHPGYCETYPDCADTWLNYRFRKTDDSKKMVDISFLIAHIPSTKEIKNTLKS